MKITLLKNLSSALALLCLFACAHSPLRGANDFFEQERYGRAIMRYRDYLKAHPDGAYAEEALFSMGKSYYHMGLTLGAQQELRSYLYLYPDGIYAEQARDIIFEVAEAARQVDARTKVAKRDVKNEIASLERDLSESRGDEAKNHYVLAGKCWSIEDYDKSFYHDMKAYDLEPKYAYDILFRSRVGFTPDGKPFSKRPDRGTIPDLIEVRNVHKEIVRRWQGGYNSDQIRRHYVLSGEVVSRATRQVNNVRLEVTIYRFGNKVLGTKTVPIGNMVPDEVRSFSVNFTILEDVYAVQNYKIKPIYDKPVH